MKINDYHVMMNKDNIKFLYQGDLEKDYDLEELIDLFELSRDDWSSRDYAEIAKSILEDNNRHKFAEFPIIYVNQMYDSNIPEDIRKICMKIFVDIIESFYN